MKYKKTLFILGLLIASFLILQWPTTTRRQTEFIKEDQTWATLQDIQNNHFFLKISQKNIPPLSHEFYHSLLKNFNPEKRMSTRNLQQMPWLRLKLFLGLKLKLE